MEGVVVSDVLDKTRIATVERVKIHPLYRKEVKTQKRFSFHDPQNESHIGDRVLIEECRPLSKTKRWRLVCILQERNSSSGD